jgi:hypothetical protein
MSDSHRDLRYFLSADPYIGIALIVQQHGRDEKGSTFFLPQK